MYYSKKVKGFTVVETLVALSILVLVVSGGFAAVSLSVNRSILSKEQVIAFYLAQEGMEMVRNKRDNNGLAGVDWLTGLTNGGPCASGNICRVDATILPSGSWSLCGGSWGTCPVLRNSGTPDHLYGYNVGWNATPFTREIRITEPGTDLIEVEIRVTWPHDGVTQQFVVNGVFYDWH